MSAPYQYYVTSFNPSVQGGFFADPTTEVITKQLHEVLVGGANNGWEFYQLVQVPVEVKPGCLGGLIGFPSKTQYSAHIVFRKPT